MSSLDNLLREKVAHGDSLSALRDLPESSIDLFLTSPPYAAARAYLRVPADEYTDWFLPFAEAMLAACKDTGSLVLNVNDNVAQSGHYRKQRHPWVYRLVLALQETGWRWVETYIWAKANTYPGRFGPRPADAFEYVYHFAKTEKPHCDLDAVRVPHKDRRERKAGGRVKTTEAGFDTNFAYTPHPEGALPTNVITAPTGGFQGTGTRHTAVMNIAVAEFFVKALCPEGGIVLDPFAGSGTTVVAALRHGREGCGIELHEEYAKDARRRIAAEQTERNAA